MSNVKIGGEWYSLCDSCQRAASTLYYLEPKLLCKACYSKVGEIHHSSETNGSIVNPVITRFECKSCHNKVPFLFRPAQSDLTSLFSLNMIVKEYGAVCLNCCNKYKARIPTNLKRIDTYSVPNYETVEEKRTRREYPFDKLIKVNDWIDIKIPPEEDFNKSISNIRSSLNYFKKEQRRDFKTRADDSKRELYIIRIK